MEEKLRSAYPKNCENNNNNRKVDQQSHLLKYFHQKLQDTEIHRGATKYVFKIYVH